MEPSDQELDLRDSLESNFEKNDALPNAAEAPQGVEEAIQPAPELPEIAIPERWPKPSKEALQFLLGLPENQGRGAAEAWLNQFKESQGYLTRIEQERADLRRRYEPIDQILNPLSQQWAMQGMDVSSGLRQMTAIAEQLARDPHGTLPKLAEMYGVNLHELNAEQPFATEQEAALRAQLSQLSNQVNQMQHLHASSQREATNRAAVGELQSFMHIKDESGQPKYPHVERLSGQMATLVMAGASLEQAYKAAMHMDDDLLSQISKETEAKQAAKRAAEAKRGLEASRTVRAKTPGSPQVKRSLRESLEEKFNES